MVLGKVVGKGCYKNSYVIEWDAAPVIKGIEESITKEDCLDPEKWRKNIRFGWRLDLDVELYDNYYNDHDNLVSEKKEQGDQAQDTKLDNESGDDEDMNSSDDDWDAESGEEDVETSENSEGES